MQSLFTFNRGRRRIIPTAAMAAASLGVLAALIASLALPASALAVEEDTKPPEVNELGVSPAAVDVTAESKTVTVTAKITDPAGPGEVSSGVQGGSITYTAPGSTTFGGCFTDSEHVCGSFVKKSAEEFTAAVTFPKFAKPGTWTPSVFVVDNAGAFKEYTTAQLEAAGFHVNVQVTSTPDTTPPEISNVKVGPPTAVTVSPPNGPQPVPAEATVTDDLTGVSFVFITYRGPGEHHFASGFLAHTTGNQFAGNIVFLPYQEAGSWSAVAIEATDGAGNRLRLEGAQLAALKLPNIEVMSSPVDLEPPKLVSLTASAETSCPEGVKGACVDAQKADRTVTLKAKVSDDLSGVSEVFLEYVAPEDGQILPLFVSLQKKSGEEFEGTVTIRRLSKAGNWKPSFLELGDGAGNFKIVFEEKELTKEISEDAWIHVSREERGVVKPGEKLSTGEKTSETNPIQSQLSIPLGGTGGEVKLKITPRTTEPPPGFFLLGQQLDIEAPTQPDTSHPLKIEFLVDASVFKPNPQVQFPPGCTSPGTGMPPPECTLTVLKNGVPVPTCAAVPPQAISPDPCIVSPQEKVGSETKLTIYSTTASAWNIGIPVTQGAKPEPTETTTSLSGGGHSGGTITVPEGTAVTDNATLSGANASKATGKVSYKVYSDKECTKEVTSAGEVEVTGGKAPPSNAKTLAPGTYYWQASYGGDEANAKSESGCGSEIETVQEGKPASAPRLAKQAVLAKLEALVPSGNRDADKRIAEAVRDIKDSLDPKLWIDDSHLTATKGEEVFQEEHEAVEHLRNIKGPAAGAVAGLVAQLVEIDRTLAQTAIDEATDPKSIAKATKEMEEAAEEIAEGEPNNAIEHYSQAWKVATKA